MTALPRRIDWIVAPPEICYLCKAPLGAAAETSSWNGHPAHRDCVRIHLLQRDPAFRGAEEPEGSDENGDLPEGPLTQDDDDPGID